MHLVKSRIAAGRAAASTTAALAIAILISGHLFEPCVLQPPWIQMSSMSGFTAKVPVVHSLTRSPAHGMTFGNILLGAPSEFQGGKKVGEDEDERLCPRD